MSDEFDKLEESIDSLFDKKKKTKTFNSEIDHDLKQLRQELKRIPIVDDPHIMLQVEYGYPLSELHYRQTGRTTRMLNFLAEEIRRTEVSTDSNSTGESKEILLLGHSHDHCRDMIGQLCEILVSRGFEVTRERCKLKTSKVIVVSYGYRNLERYRRRYDSVYIDPSCFDIEAQRMREMVLITPNNNRSNCSRKSLVDIR